MPSLTTEQANHLHNTVTSQGFGQQGRSRSEVDNARAVLHLHNIIGPESPLKGVVSYDRAVKLIASAEKTTPQKVREIHRLASQNASLAPPEVKRLKRSDPRHLLFGEGGAPIPVQSVVFTKLEETKQLNTYASLSTLGANILQETGIDVPRSTLHYWLKEMGAIHADKKLTGLTEKHAYARIRSYVMRYAEMLREEARGNVVPVWMDESYIHTGYCVSKGWFFPSASAAAGPVTNRVTGSEKGKRIIIIHAMSRKGMLEQKGVVPSDNLAQVQPSACVVSTTLSSEGISPEDYHDTMNGDKFLAWLKNRLIPAFKAQFGRRKMCLIMDNAGYHHIHGADWVTPSKMNKVELGSFLRYAKYKEITVIDQTTGEKTIFKAAKFTADMSQGGPGVEAMKKVVSDHVKSHPSINTTLVQQLMKPLGYSLLYTPPYESWLQPIELVWAQAKHKVATQAMKERTHQQTAQQTIEALQSISEEACANIIAHTEKLMSNWLTTSEAGSLQSFGSLESLKFATPAQLKRCTDLSLENAGIIGEADVEKENRPPRSNS